MIDLIFLGNGAMMPTPRRWLSSFLLRLNGKLILFDAGEGTQVPWQKSGWGFKRLDTICLSHWHADHIAGLPGILHAVALSGRTDPVTIIGPKGTRNVVLQLRSIAPELPFDVRVADLANGQGWAIGDLRVQVWAGVHRVPVLVYRFDLPRARAFLAELATERGVPRSAWNDLSRGVDVVLDDQVLSAEDFLGPVRRGISIGVMTDTRPVPGIAEHLQDVDLLIAEGTYGDSLDRENAERNRHMTFAEAAGVASDAGTRRLILTHFSPKMDTPEDWIGEARSRFAATDLAVPGQTISLRYRSGEAAGTGDATGVEAPLPGNGTSVDRLV